MSSVERLRLGEEGVLEVVGVVAAAVLLMLACLLLALLLAMRLSLFYRSPPLVMLWARGDAVSWHVEDPSASESAHSVASSYSQSGKLKVVGEP